MAKRKLQYEKQRKATRWHAFQVWLKQKSIIAWVNGKCFVTILDNQ